MRLKVQILFFLIGSILLLGCSAKEEDSHTYFGGKIINPKTDHVVLFYQEKAIDTFKLDDNDSFLKKINLEKEGLYYFKHGIEHQYVYIEPKDSILVRLNTYKFDETLVFSGKGADRNNMLVDCFIDSEKDERRFYKLYKLEPDEFRTEVNKLENLKMKRFEQFVDRNQNETESFKNVLKMALTYPLYSKVERYPLARRETNHTLRLNELDSTFYSHRNKVSMNQDSIMFFYAYRDFLMSHLYNSVFSEGLDINSDEFTIQLMNKIDGHVGFESIKNTLLRQITIGHFYRKSSCAINKSAFQTFFEKSTSEEDKQLVSRLLSDISSVHKGEKLNSFGIVDYNHTEHNIQNVIRGKNSVVYFWNPDYMSKGYVSSKINYLSRKYPNINFVGINLKDGKHNRIRRIDIKSQFYLHESSKANEFLTSQMPRTILVNKKGIVVNGYASLSSQNIYQQVGELAKY